MNADQEQFLKMLREAFQTEAREHLQAISSALQELEAPGRSAGQKSMLENAYREAHSLKGAARAVNRVDIESACQAMEGVFSALKTGKLGASRGVLDLFHETLDFIEDLLPREAAPDAPNPAAGLIARLNALKDGAPALPAEKERAAEPAREKQEPREPPPAPAEPRPVAADKTPPNETIRIATSKLDTLLLEAEELLTLKQAAGRQVTDLRELLARFETWRNEWAKTAAASGAPNRREAGGTKAAAHRDFLEWNLFFVKSLENKIASLTSAAERDARAAGKLVDTLLEDSKKLVMLPFSTISALFPKVVRDLCRAQGKEAHLVLRGNEVEIDKRILEEMKDPLIHLVRNCIDHGIEMPEVREKAGKPARGTITLSVTQKEGNKVELLLADDGGGIDVERVKRTAVQRGLISDDEAEGLSEEEAISLIFKSDLSTSAEVTEISGRGLGLAIVRQKAEKLGGRVGVETNPRRGSTFRILLPLALATFRGILVRAGGQIFVVPTARVERAGRVRSSDIRTVENRETIALNGRALSWMRLEHALGLPRENEPEADEFLPFLVMGSGDRQIAFGIDEILSEEEVLVKSLSKPLSRVRNIAGATVLSSNRAAPILNVADLIKSAGRGGVAPARTAAPARPGRTSGKSILIAEDSITSRMLLKNIVESAGYSVKTAVDGQDAWTLLRAEDFDLVVSDVEMPRVNGFDLTARIRQDRKLAEKPVVLLTALASREDRERGIDAGANAYLVKSSFDQSNLLETIRRLI